MTTLATAQVKGGFWAQYATSFSSISGKGFARRMIAQLLGKKQNMALREIMETLDGVAAGSTAQKTYTRVANSTELGGVRTVETQTLVNRATVAGDVTIINADLLTLSTRTYDPTPVANGDGNPLGTR